MSDLLHQIQTLQFQDKNQAETLLLSFLREIFSAEVQTVELRPLAVSLNSFNGFMNLTDGSRYFFKTHTEPDGVISEYYNATQLADAGYPVIKPIFSSTEAGKQLLVYEVIYDQSVFDAAWTIESGDVELLRTLTIAQEKSDQQLYTLYLQSLAQQGAKDTVKAPIHQLFFHRLSGGRLHRFYGPLPDEPGEFPKIELPGGWYSMAQVRNIRWEINGQNYRETLDDLIKRALLLLQPLQNGPSIIGHGDAHNGNVFLRQHTQPPSLLYFDPAFAGRHHPLLDLTKPIFHNVFAMWMYFPQIKQAQTPITFRQIGNLWRLEYNYPLHSVRKMFLTSKVEHVLKPFLRELVQHKDLRHDWRAYFKAALFCCPFLTMNLTDKNKFSPEISLLGLAMAVEMGAESAGVRSYIDQVLDDVEVALGI